ncbi:MAG TPA: 3-carboxy-cis,cis-muconate cycloisomerase [Anaerolineales bacterium]|nr:3-carboxy-cis,cis-muconate cycloisomerase [Anaerolineales bacterium]
MPASPSDSRIFGPLFNSTAMAEIFSDEGFVRSLLDVEGALARVQGQLGVIPAETAEQIASQAGTLSVDFDQLRSGTERTGFPVIELVRQLRAHVGNDSADYVHWGTTTQDVMDTALVLQIRAALAILEPELKTLIQSLARLADQHRHTLMAGRTHSQQGLPIPFGLKVAGWLAPLIRHCERLSQLKPRILVLQFGGAAGTLAALGKEGIPVRNALSAELEVGIPLLPWHTQRDALAELANWLSLVTGALAKMAQDVILLAQSEIAEARESSDLARGGSSAMPQKSNPVVSEFILVAHRTNASLLSSMHQALVQEHERGTYGQMEWLALPQMFALTGSALEKSAWLGENLVVHADRMRANVAASEGLMLAEAVSYALAPYMGFGTAKKAVSEAAQRAAADGRHLLDILREQIQAPLDWESLREEANYLGVSETFIDEVIQSAAQI